MLDSTSVFRYALYMEDLYAALTGKLAAWVNSAAGASVKPEAFRIPRDEGQLSLGAFVLGGAGEAARKLEASLEKCPDLRMVKEKKGWLLFYLSNTWFDGLIAWARTLDVRPAGSYLENRMAVLVRKGDAPCPDQESVRRALWAAFLAYRRQSWRDSDERMVLAMTHGLTGEDRIALENRCGGVAAAIIKLRGERT